MPTPDIWARAGAVIDEEFGVEILYTGAGLDSVPIQAIRQDSAAMPFVGVGNTLREIRYEVAKALLPGRPTKQDTFIDQDIVWQVDDITDRDDIGKWVLVVVDTGPA